jgi:mannose-6-phosphate isomerase-like protein (cupin superfamily)
MSDKDPKPPPRPNNDDKVQQDEYEVPVRGKMASLESFPNVYTEAGSQEVIDTDDYKIFDLHYENELGHCLWTTIYITLKPWKHTYYFQFGINMHYQVTDGEIWFMIGTTGKVLTGKTKQMVVIPAGKHHMLMNQRQDKESYCTVQVPARLDLRQYLGIVMPDNPAEWYPPTGTFGGGG